MHKNSLKIILVFSLLITIFAPAQSNIDSLKLLAEKTQGKEKLKLLIKIGYYLSSNNPNEAIAYLDKAINIADETGNKWSKADALFNKGVALWHLGSIKESGDYYNKAKIIYEEFKDTLSLMKVLSSEAINNSMNGEPDLALEKFFKSLAYAKKIGDRSTIFNDLFNLGIIFDNKGEFDKALTHYLLAIQYVDDKGNLALIQNYIAEIYITQKKYKEAETYLMNAVKNARLSADDNSLVWAYTNLGNLNLTKSNYTEAENYFINGLNLARKTDYKLDIIHSLFELGKFYDKTKNYNQAEKYLLEAYRLSDSINSLQDLSNISGILASIYSTQPNYKQAYDFLKANKQFSDSLFEITNNGKVAEVETKYAVKQKEKEAEVLLKQNTLQKKIIETQELIAIIVSGLGVILLVLVWLLVRSKRKMLIVQNSLIQKNEEIEISRKEINEKNTKLEELNSAKDKFFSIIAHDLRNPVAAFVNISEILETDFDNLNDEDKKSLLAQMNTSSKNLITLLENLLTWARLSSNKIEVIKQKINLSQIIESSIYPYEHWANNKNISLQVNVDGDVYINTDPFAFRAIIGNLINNAIKFSNPGGKIAVSLKSDDGKQKLSIKDNGVGIAEERLKTLFKLNSYNTTKGTDNESGTGLGLVLVKDLVDKMNWYIKVNSKINEGAEFMITIPV